VYPKQTLICLSLLLIALGLWRCANPVSPTGGPKDVTPPKVTLCDPPQYSLFFKSDKIRITFNKFIQLKDPSSMVNIAPPLLPNTDYSLRGKTLLIKIDDSLKKNTTYSIMFGDAIADITENNVLHDFSYVFSTGKYIDSLSLKGKILDAFNLLPQKDVLAMLYVNENDTLPFDSLPFHVRPYYMTKTNENGEFNFHNIRDIPFKLFALKDMNGNYIYDLPNERVGFIDSLVQGAYVPELVTDTAKADSTRYEDFEQKQDSVKPVDTLVLNIPEIPSFTLHLFEKTDSTQKILKSDLVNEDQVRIIFHVPSIDPVFTPLNFLPDTAWNL
jgi:hypothetical protein